jgi:L-fuconolactonase
MDKIDSHVHFWKFDTIRDSWITPEMGAIRHDFLPNDFFAASNLHNIKGCVAVQASQTEEENHFLLSLTKENKFIKGIVGWINLINPALEERLDYWREFELIKGWRHILQAEDDQFILQPAVIKGLQILHQYHYTYDLLCYHHQLGTILKLVHQLPNQAFVLDHCGKPDIKGKNLDKWKEHIKELAQNKNVYCKVSGLFTEADWDNYQEADILNCLALIFEHFGPARVMYASDWPVMLISKPYNDWCSLLERYCSQFTELEQEMIFSSNAVSFYKL